jgi:protein-S-isoprenylcysteine O-methyltransferase Ste14
MSKTHEQRDDLAGEHRLTDVGQLVGAAAFLAVWATDSFFLRLSTFLSGIIPGYVLIPPAVLILAFSAVMAWVSHNIVFGERRDPPVVITKAFFKFVRHPLYLSEILLYFGLFLLTCSLFSLAVIAAVSIFLNYVAGVEEKKLEAAFGARYLDYKKRVGKWLPKMTGRKR